jgi:hypothetical protein
VQWIDPNISLMEGGQPMTASQPAVALCLLGLCGLVLGQSQGQLAYDVDDADFWFHQSTAPSLAVGGLAAVVAGSHGLVLFDKAGNMEDSKLWTGNLPVSGYPFVPAYDGTLRSLVHPRAEYDPISGRLWMLYSENYDVAPETEWKCVQLLHMAVSGDPAGYPTPGTLDSLSNDHWWYYTGNEDVSTEGNGGEAFDFNSGAINSFTSNPLYEGNHRPTEDTVRFPSVGFDERAVIMAFSGHGLCATDDDDAFQQFIYIIPREREDAMGNPLKFIDGERPLEDDFISIRMMGEPLIEDVSVKAYVVQEPYEQYDNVTLMVSTDGTDSGTLQDSVRVKGLFFEEGPGGVGGKWQVRQRLRDLSPGWEVLDMDLSSYGLEFFRPDANPMPPAQPDFPEAFGFTPTVEEDMFTSAVLTKDASGNPRVFAVHAVLPDDGTGSPEDYWVVQWYVIDPHLTDGSTDVFHDAAIESEDWRPTIVEAGRIEVEGGHCYHPVLGVSTGGLMTIEYTYSALGVPQEIRRQRFDASHTPIGSATTLRTGPSQGHQGPRWALWGDLQFDPNPATGPGACNWLWSTHTLVDEDATSSSTIRDVWLFRKASTPFCFQTDLNQNGFTDLADMALYTDYYAAGDPRADTDADGQVDAIDMLNYVDAYDAATGP